MVHLKTKIAEYGLVFKENKLLILRFSKETNPGERWIFPGGRVDEGEMPKEGLFREISEEVGIKSEIVCPCDVTMWGIEDDHRYAVFFVCKYISGEVNLSHEHQDFKWMSEADIEVMDYHDASFKEIVKKAFETNKSL